MSSKSRRFKAAEPALVRSEQVVLPAPVKSEQVVYNCHVHTFTLKHVPRYVGLRIVTWLMKPRVLRSLVIPILLLVSKIRRFRLWRRYASFLSLGSEPSQEHIFNLLQARYPRGTKFVVLPMDLAHLKSGMPLEAPDHLDKQHEQLAELARKYKELVVPFFAVDPRRPGILDKLKDAVEKRGFRGIKLYPNLGYAPTHAGLRPIWEFADKMKLPVMTHCSRGGMHGYDDVRKRMVTSGNSGEYGAPELYVPILKQYPNMRLCLAHLGGQEEWDKFLNDPWYVPKPGGDLPKQNKSKPWLRQILDMLPNHENLYTDISYTIFYFQDFVPALKVFLTDPLVRTRILFGSDYYMADLEADNERLLSLNLRAALGEDLFWEIANTNPKAYLGSR